MLQNRCLPPRPPSYFTIPYERDTVQVASIPPEARAGRVLPGGDDAADGGDECGCRSNAIRVGGVEGGARF